MLDEKIEYVRDALAQRLEQGEMKDADFVEFVYSQLVAQEIIQGEREEEKYSLAVRVSLGMEDKLGTLRQAGITQRYVFLPNHISESADSDIAHLRRIEDEVETYLTDVAEERSLPREKFQEMVKDYLTAQSDTLENVAEEYHGTVIARVQGKLDHKYVDLDWRSSSVGGVKVSDLEAAIAKL